MKKYPSLLLRREISDDDIALIIDNAKKDDTDSLTKLCQYVYARIYSYIFYRVKHREDAEDLTSEVILKMVKALKGQKGNFHAWIYKIATNTIIDFYRRRTTHSEVSLSELPTEIPDKSAAFSEQVLTQEKLRKALKHITDEQKHVVLLRFIEGYNNEEISKIMGKSVGAIKVLQFRALKSMKKYFERKGYKSLQK
jgi:RNA polymerase sigma-70 factor (ECF subfamily)